MPISTIDGLPTEHWAEVLVILKEVINEAGFEPNLVSASDESGIIQKRIIQNLYKNEIIVCDVSAKNPNVMFELGLRLAFDKPTIIIKDDQTDYSFDTSVIEHVPYPRDLRFTKILKFKEVLKKKIENTYKASKEDKNYTTFLKHFGEFTIANLEQKEVLSEKYVLESLEELKEGMERISRGFQNRNSIPSSRRENLTGIVYNALLKNEIKDFMINNKLKFKEDIIEADLLDQLINFIKVNPKFNDSRLSDSELKVLIRNLLLN